jgi:putative tryptophan/tyrosine transport system substrate-binding protein
LVWSTNGTEPPAFIFKATEPPLISNGSYLLLLFFPAWAKLIASLVGRYRVPAIYPRREFAESDGLMRYGYDVADGYRRLGGYGGRIVKGEKAGDLPVFQPTKFELVINLKTARALGFEIPVKLLALADEVIQ